MPSIEFSIADNKLRLIYQPRDDSEWVYEKFKRNEELILKGTFHLRRKNLLIDNVDEIDLKSTFNLETRDVLVDTLDGITFVVASLNGNYFQFDPKILPIGVPVLLANDATPSWKWFSAERRVSILKVIAELRPTRIVIGGDLPDAIPVDEYERLIAQFPTPHEIHRYVLARVSTVVRQYTDATTDAERLFSKYVEHRVKNTTDYSSFPFRELEIRKYELILLKLKEMLRTENGYSESTWQGEILKIIKILNPKYITAFTSVPIWDSDSEKQRQIDMILVDASGNLDVIEIKKPFEKCIVTESKYRDNHVPLRELSGTVMQIEKYLRHLNRSGINGEQKLTHRYSDQLPPNFKIKITNPSGILIMGRDTGMSDEQRRDFEVARRHYKHIADIITYDDLLRRLEAVLEQFRGEQNSNDAGILAASQTNEDAFNLNSTQQTAPGDDPHPQAGGRS